MVNVHVSLEVLAKIGGGVKLELQTKVLDKLLVITDSDLFAEIASRQVAVNRVIIIPLVCF